MTDLIAIKDGVKAAYSDAIAKSDWKRTDKLEALFELFQFKGEMDEFEVGDLMVIRDDLVALWSGVDGGNQELDAETMGMALEALDRVIGAAIHG
jgi:hypothetical protein